MSSDTFSKPPDKKHDRATSQNLDKSASSVKVKNPLVKHPSNPPPSQLSSSLSKLSSTSQRSKNSSDADPVDSPQSRSPTASPRLVKATSIAPSSPYPSTTRRKSMSFKTREQTANHVFMNSPSPIVAEYKTEGDLEELSEDFQQQTKLKDLDRRSSISFYFSPAQPQSRSDPHQVQEQVETHAHTQAHTLGQVQLDAQTKVQEKSFTNLKAIPTSRHKRNQSDAAFAFDSFSCFGTLDSPLQVPKTTIHYTSFKSDTHDNESCHAVSVDSRGQSSYNASNTNTYTSSTSSTLSEPKITLGICVMSKKIYSKPMQNIMNRLQSDFEIVPFPEDTIFNQPIQEWPIVRVLICFFSKGFPLSKAEAYVALRKPYLINDLHCQHMFFDRAAVYKRLNEYNVPTPKYFVIQRNPNSLLPSQVDPEGFIETDDYVEYNCVQIHKPFVEKPISGEDHNINIYYPRSMGGGVKRLFRKVDNRSSEYDPHHPGTVRRDGTYLYESFMFTEGTDVKVYTVGPFYAHAEARKSPVVDGRVLRTSDGKELRYPVLLSPMEKMIARNVSLIFGQKVCGFDLLRCKGKSFVCDVNGWSFVKNSVKYYDDAAGILRKIVFTALCPHRLFLSMNDHFPQFGGQDVGTGARTPSTFEDSAPRSRRRFVQVKSDLGDVEPPAPKIYPLESGDVAEGEPDQEELRCVIAVIRHGDRTPKQKMKITVTNQKILDLMEANLDSKGKEAKLKSPAQLQDLLDIVRELFMHTKKKFFDAEIEEQREALKEEAENLYQIKLVLSAGGHFSGVNRKVQLKPTAFSDEIDPLTGRRKAITAMLVLKHGGVLTHAGRSQAESLGKRLRAALYPFDDGESLHSSYQHDLKIYTSDEGRVQTSAAAFSKGLLDLEGVSLTPILVSLINKDASMLDAFGKSASGNMLACKRLLYSQLTFDSETNASMMITIPDVQLSNRSDSEMGGSEVSSISEFNPYHYPVERDDFQASKDGWKYFPKMPENPLNLLRKLYEETLKVCGRLEELKKQDDSDVINKWCDDDDDLNSQEYDALSMSREDWQEMLSKQPGQPCGGEKIIIIYDRWQKLLKTFYSAKKGFDCSKIPDIYDAVKYDAIHNSHLKLPLECLYTTASTLADCIVPNEYGLSPWSRRIIGASICGKLLWKIIDDMNRIRIECNAIGHNDNLAGQDLFAEVTMLFKMLKLESSILRASRPVSNIHDEQYENRSSSDSEEEKETLHKPLSSGVTDKTTHLRTRIYFTSESHIHSLINVLRTCDQSRHDTTKILLDEKGKKYIDECPEYDYLTHIVFRMYENSSFDIEDPKRFRVEVLFSPGAYADPTKEADISTHHTLPTKPRKIVTKLSNLDFATFSTLLGPFATKLKNKPSSGF